MRVEQETVDRIGERAIERVLRRIQERRTLDPENDILCVVTLCDCQCHALGANILHCAPCCRTTTPWKLDPDARCRDCGEPFANDQRAVINKRDNLIRHYDCLPRKT